MSDEHAPDYETRFAVEAMRQELKEAKSFSRNWAVIAVSAVFAIACCFVFALFVAGLGALRENTRVVRDLRTTSVANRAVLDGFRQDMESNSLRFQILQKQLQNIEASLLRRGGGR